MLAGLILAEANLKPIIIEQGSDVDNRIKDIEKFWSGGKLNTSSNVQFGAGGAGTFSDGKLTTGVSDDRKIKLLDSLIAAGAPEEIKYLLPHQANKRIIDATAEKINLDKNKNFSNFQNNHLKYFYHRSKKIN